MGKIAILSETLSNQIAAGEVVERPASALKELVENALDAGSDRCDVAIDGGGITRLFIRDTGCGMSPEDARLSLQRHATSKLRSFEELSALSSFGFRGEALPSIASVSRLTLRTRSADADAGIELVVEGGLLTSERPTSMAVGTEIEVRDLFYNVPARRKFLRASGTEAGHVTDVLEAAALARPDVSFTLERDGRRAREWLRVRTRQERVAQVLSEDALAVCRGERGPLGVEAFLDRPEHARAGANGLRLLCNGRPIRDRAVLLAVSQAYGSVLERGRYPKGVVYLDLPPELVDVNVHPQKSEVRFADGRAVCDAVHRILADAVAHAFTLPNAPKNRWFPVNSTPPSSAAPETPPLPASFPSVTAVLNALSPSEQVTKPQPGRAPTDADNQQRGGNQLLFTRDISAPHAAATSLPAPSSAVPSSAATTPTMPAAPAHPPPLSAQPQSQPRRVAEDDGEHFGQLQFRAQVRGTYLICEGEAGLYVLDQHAAAERVTFDRLKRQYEAAETSSQALLFPALLEISLQEATFIEESGQLIERFGFELQVRSEKQASIHRVPRLLQNVNPEHLVRTLLTELMRGGREFSQAVDLTLATLACHGSLRAGALISLQEAQALLSALNGIPFAGHCPHGRPILSFTPWAELERKVGRR